MRTRYLFFDVDGTLLPFGQGLPESTRKALLAARANGHRLFLSTGRGPMELDPRLSVIPFDGGVYAGGASARVGEKDIFTSYLSREALEWIYSYAAEKGWKLLLQTDEGTFLTKEMEEALYALFMKSLGRLLVIGGLKVVSELPLREDATKLVFITADHDAREAAPGLSRYFDVVDNTMGVPLEDCAELVQKGISKAVGMHRILEYYGASAEDSIAFGDGANDIEIIREAGTGVAMGNASPELKSVADYVTRDILDDGISSALEHLGVI